MAGNTGEVEYRQDVGNYKHPSNMQGGETGLPVRCTQAERWATEENTMPRNYIDTTETQGNADDKQATISDSFPGIRHMTGGCEGFRGARAGSFLQNQTAPLGPSCEV